MSGNSGNPKSGAGPLLSRLGLVWLLLGGLSIVVDGVFNCETCNWGDGAPFYQVFLILLFPWFVGPLGVMLMGVIVAKVRDKQAMLNLGCGVFGLALPWLLNAAKLRCLLLRDQ